MPIAPPLTLTSVQLAKLKALQNRNTSYELVLQDANGHKFLICYTERNSTAGIIQAIRGRGGALTAVIGAAIGRAAPPSLDFHVVKKVVSFKLATPPHTLVGSAQLSGRTKRQSIIEGELLHIADVVQVTEQPQAA